MTTLTAAAPSLLPREAELRTGRGLAFVLGAWRGGTTLLRKVLDTHPAVYSPAETWYLLPLLNMWEGLGTHPGYNVGQAAAAIKQHLSQPAFVECVRAFAGRFYAETMPRDATLFVDKTPFYLRIAGALPTLFPEARFIVLARDPRSVLWSRHTWKHAEPGPIESQVAGVAGDIRALAGFLEHHPDRAHVVSYERLCTEPEAHAAEICDHLGLDRCDAMVRYGDTAHHEGYGDELTRRHARPHDASVRRWEGGLPDAVQRALAAACGTSSLERLGYGELAALAR